MSDDQSVSGHTLHGGRPMWEVRPGPVTGGRAGGEPETPPQIGDTQQIPVVPTAPTADAEQAQASEPAPQWAGHPGQQAETVAPEQAQPQATWNGQQASQGLAQATPQWDAAAGQAQQYAARAQAPGEGPPMWNEAPATAAPGPAGPYADQLMQMTSPEQAGQQWPGQHQQPPAPYAEQQFPGAPSASTPYAEQQLSGAPYGGQQVAMQAPEMVPARVPTAQDFLQGRHQAIDIGPANWGWRGWIRRWSFGLIKPKMGVKEREHREARASVQRSFSGPRTIVFANPKGGAAKTTSVLAAGFTFGTIRGGGVVAWDNNETRGTLGIRGERANHQNTTRELLDDLERFSDVYESRIGDLGAFVRSQGDAHFDVLASDERADVTGQIKASDFGAVHRLLERFYHLILVDTGNNLRAENWLASAEAADLIVVTCTVREDTGYSGLWMLDALADAGHADLKSRTVTILADPSPSVDAQLAADLVDVYSQRTRAVFRIPYDPALVAGSVVQYSQLSEDTRTAWLKACAEMARAL